MKIPYTACCQKCKEGGKENRLQRDLSEPEVLFCAEGHKFSGPEIEEYLDSNVAPAVPAPDFGFPGQQAPEIVPMPSIPAPAVEQLERELQEAVERTSPFELSPPPSAPRPGAATELSVLHHEEETAAKMSRALASAKAPQVATAVAEPEPAARPAPATPVDPHSPKKPIRQLPGGAMEITVVIPDPHANYLQGEAEFRGKTVQQHFEEVLLAGLESRWWY